MNTNVITTSSTQGTIYTFTSSALCPDLLTIEKIGEADNLRGKVVRTFFHLMRIWPA